MYVCVKGYEDLSIRVGDGDKHAILCEKGHSSVYVRKQEGE